VTGVQGQHIEQVDIWDLVNNQNSATGAFIYDISAPVISGVGNNGYYSGGVTPTITDAYSPYTVTLNSGAYAT
jgi:hypothetical protein